MLALSLGSPALRRAPGLPVQAPPPVAVRVSAIGDSWTENNMAVTSRTGSTIASDDWTWQLAEALGFAHSAVPGEAGVTQNVVVRAGYGGQKSQAIKTNWLSITAADPSRKGDIKLIWPGRNDVPDAGGDANVVAAVDAIVADSTSDTIVVAIPMQGSGFPEARDPPSSCSTSNGSPAITGGRSGPTPMR